MRQQEILDYLALWRLVAHYIGTPTEYFETPERAKSMMESLLISEIRPNETSRVLANNIILSLQGQPPAYASRDFLIASARWLNGDELADALGLSRPSLYYKVLVAGQCIFFVFICYTYRSIPYLDRRKLKVRRPRTVCYFLLTATGTPKDLLSSDSGEQDPWLGGRNEFRFQVYPELRNENVDGRICIRLERIRSREEESQSFRHSERFSGHCLLSLLEDNIQGSSHNRRVVFFMRPRQFSRGSSLKNDVKMSIY
jgi:ER-bound oxygenase mpaB/B'/Rubber oxygenase, catalytic domain